MKSSDKDFVAEAEELLEGAGQILTELQTAAEEEPSPDAINSLFRAMHTLKGMAGIYGYQGLSDISHVLENLLDDIRMGKAELGEDVIAFLFDYLEVLRSSLESVLEKSFAENPEETAARVKQIEEFRVALQRRGASEPESDSLPEDIVRVLSEYEEHRLRYNVKKGNAIYMLSLAFSLTDFDVELKKVTEKVKPLGELISTMPTSENVPDGSIGFNLMVGSAEDIGAFTSAVGAEPRVLVRGRSAQKAAVAQPEPTQQSSLKSATTTVRVNIDKLDKILNTISEVSLIKAANRSVWEELVEAYGHTPLLIDLYRINQSFDRRLIELQNNVLELRMVPVAQMFGRLAQIVRRQSADIGKKISLQTFGEDTEIDKFLAEEIIDPLMHLVRNSIDHGVESPEDRIKAGKPDTGNISLRAFQRGDSVVVEVRDDGHGIDAEKVRKKALQKGLITDEMELGRQEVMGLIFMPGFSTKDSVSEVSGRGVGLDVVKNKLASLGALVDIDTELGKGTTFTLTLPITIAIIKSLMVKVGSEMFAIPVSALHETTAIDPGLLSSVEGKTVYNLRGEMLPMISLGDALELDSPPGERQFAFVIGHAERKMGVLVDEIIGQQDVVIKPISEYLSRVRGFAGAAEISRHRVILVIDVEAIIDEAVSRRAQSIV